MITLGELAAYLELPVGAGDPATVLTGLAPLERASGGHLSFVADKKYLRVLAETSASCVLLKEEWAEHSPVPVLCAADPYLAYARATRLFDPKPVSAVGVHPSAVVHETATLAEDVSVGPNACIEAGAELEAGVVIASGVFVGADCRVGARSRIEPNVVLYRGVTLGTDCLVHAATVIGSDGFGFARKPDGWEKIHQIGGVRVGDRVEIGASCAIDRGALDDTVIGDDVIIDNQVHIAHNCEIGARTAIAGCVGIAGSTRIGADCSFAGQVGVSGHVEICDNSHFMGQARVNGSVREPGSYGSGTALEAVASWKRNAVRFTQLDALHRRVAVLERALQNNTDAESEGDR